MKTRLKVKEGVGTEVAGLVPSWLREFEKEAGYMPTREEIREGIIKRLNEFRWELQKPNAIFSIATLTMLQGSFADQILKDEDSQGVVKKVKRELPNVTKGEFEEWCGSHFVKGCGKVQNMCDDYCRTLARIDKAGYPLTPIAVEPLIGG